MMTQDYLIDNAVKCNYPDHEANNVQCYMVLSSDFTKSLNQCLEDLGGGLN